MEEMNIWHITINRDRIHIFKYIHAYLGGASYGYRNKRYTV